MGPVSTFKILNEDKWNRRVTEIDKNYTIAINRSKGFTENNPLTKKEKFREET